MHWDLGLVYMENNDEKMSEMNECKRFLLELSREDLEYFIDVLNNPPEPNEKLIRGFKQYYESSKSMKA